MIPRRANAKKIREQKICASAPKNSILRAKKMHRILTWIQRHLLDTQTAQPLRLIVFLVVYIIVVTKIKPPLLLSIQPGKPWQNGKNESFAGHLRGQRGARGLEGEEVASPVGPSW